MKSKIMIIVAVLVIIGAVVFMNIGSVAKGLIEKIASHTMQTEVTISKLNISIADKSIIVEGITIANPKGFKGDYFLRVNKIAVTAEDLTGDAIILEEILVDGVDIQYELTAKGSNISAIKKNLKSSGSSDSSSKDAGKSLVINSFKLHNSRVTPSLMIGDIGTKAPIDIADITIRNIGSKSKPARPADVIIKVMNSLLPAITKAVSKAGFGEALLNGVVDDFEGRKNKASKALNSLFKK